MVKQAKAVSKEAVEQVKWALKNPDQFKQKVSQAYESIKHMELAKITDDMTWGEKGKTALSNVGIVAAQYVQGTIEGRIASIKSFLEDGKATIDSWKYYTDPKEGAHRRAELVQSIKYTVTHPKETVQGVISSYKETFKNFKETLSNGNVYDWAYQINKTSTDIALEVIGSKGTRLVAKESIKSFNHVIEGNKGKINFNNKKNNNNNSQNVDERKTEDSKGISKSKWWHPGYVDNLSSSQILLGVKQSGKGLSTLGSATRSEALSAGKAWVGNDAKEIIENGQIIGYSSKERAFRLQYKPKEGMWRANFQENSFVNTVGGQKRVEIKNVHIDILD